MVALKILQDIYLIYTMPVNAENFFMTMGFELTTSATPPSSALSATSTNCAIETIPKKDCSKSADIGIG